MPRSGLVDPPPQATLDALVARGQGESIFAFCRHKAQVEAAARSASHGPAAPGGVRTQKHELARLRAFFKDSWLEVQKTHAPQPQSWWLAQVQASEALGDSTGAAMRREQMANVKDRGPLASKLIPWGARPGMRRCWRSSAGMAWTWTCTAARLCTSGSGS